MKHDEEQMKKNFIQDFDLEEEPVDPRKKRAKEPLKNWVLPIVILVLVAFAVLLGAIALLKFQESKEAVVEVTYTYDEVQQLLDQENQNKELEINQAKEQAREGLLNEIRISLATGDSIIQAIRPFYPNDIVVASSGAYNFIPIDPQLAKNPLVQSGLLITEEGEYQYTKDGEMVSKKGIDVSSHQGKIKWDQVAQDGVEFAYIRALYRGYGSTGKLVEDERFDANMQGAINNGIEVGVYVFTQAITEEEILQEAQLAIKKASQYTNSCTIVVDVEKTVDASGRMNALSPEERTRLVKLFCDTVEEAGFHPMIYFNLEMAMMMLDLDQLEGIDKWFASYSDTLYYPYDYKVWQYSEKGTVAGINGPVDMDISLFKLSN